MKHVFAAGPWHPVVESSDTIREERCFQGNQTRREWRYTLSGWAGYFRPGESMPPPLRTRFYRRYQRHLTFRGNL